MLEDHDEDVEMVDGWSRGEVSRDGRWYPVRICKRWHFWSLAWFSETEGPSFLGFAFYYHFDCSREILQNPMTIEKKALSIFWFYYSLCLRFSSSREDCCPNTISPQVFSLLVQNPAALHRSSVFLSWLRLSRQCSLHLAIIDASFFPGSIWGMQVAASLRRAWYLERGEDPPLRRNPVRQSRTTAMKFFVILRSRFFAFWSSTSTQRSCWRSWMQTSYGVRQS